jgi:hypothetical protein
VRPERLERVSAGTVYNYLPVNIGDTLDILCRPDERVRFYCAAALAGLKIESSASVTKNNSASTTMACRLNTAVRIRCHIATLFLYALRA